MKPRFARPSVRLLGLLVLASPLAFVACEDPVGPRIWGNMPDTVDLYSLARPEFIDRPGAYDFLVPGGSPRIVETTTLPPFSFDIAITEDEAGEFVILPTGVFADASATPGIIVDDTASFDGLRRAPSEGYTVDEPVAASTDVIYVVRSRQDQRGCRSYGKMEILSIGTDGVVRIRTLINPNCNDRSLVPNAPEPEDEGEGG